MGPSLGVTAYTLACLGGALWTMKLVGGTWGEPRKYSVA
jgi:hypothetical protein